MAFIEAIRRLLGRSGQDGGRGAVPAEEAASRIGQPEEEELLPGDYWHFTSASSVNFLFNNVWAGQGWLPSMSRVRRTHGERFVTPGDLYPLTGQDAEEVWERVRAERFPHKPSRRGAMFLFDRRELAEDCATKWKPETDTVVLRVRIPRNARVHAGHIGWFDSAEAPREEDAARYWAREPCPDWPDLWEYVVDGDVYFPDWREPPFGPFGGKACEVQSGPALPVLPAEFVTCPLCGIEFKATPVSSATFSTADRPRCIDDPDRPILCDCPNVAQLVQAAWERLGKAAG